MKADAMRRVRGLTWVGWLNYLLLRWFFVRLAYRVEDDGEVSGFFVARWIWPFPWASFRRIGRS